MKKILIPALLIALVLPSIAQTAEEPTVETRLEELEQQLAALEKEVEEAKKQPAPQEVIIEGSTKLTWKWDLLTSGTAFTDELDLKLRFPLDSGSRVKSLSEKGNQLRGMLSISRFDLSVQNTGLATNPGTVSARIEYGDLSMELATNPSFLQDKALPVGNVNNNIRTSNVSSDMGMSVGYAKKGTSLSFSVGTLDEEINNPYNKYAFGLNGNFRVIKQLLNLEAGAVYGARLGYVRDPDINFRSQDIGFSLKPVLSFSSIAKGAQLTLAADFAIPYDTTEKRYGAFEWDARADFRVDLSETGKRDDGSDGRSNVLVSVYSIPSEWILDTRLSFVELAGDGGLVPVIGGNLSVAVLNILRRESAAKFNLDGTIAWEAAATVNAKLGDFTPSVTAAYGSANSNYKENLGITAGLKVEPVEKLEFEAVYNSKNVNHTGYDEQGAYLGDMGTFAISAKLSF